jgi:hypothetical protein
VTTDKVLDAWDVAKRLDRALDRVLRIMWEARQLGLADQVASSGGMAANGLGALRAELDAWHVEPAPLVGQEVALGVEAPSVTVIEGEPIEPEVDQCSFCQRNVRSVIARWNRWFCGEDCARAWDRDRDRRAAR